MGIPTSQCVWKSYVAGDFLPTRVRERRWILWHSWWLLAVLVSGPVPCNPLSGALWLCGSAPTMEGHHTGLYRVDKAMCSWTSPQGPCLHLHVKLPAAVCNAVGSLFMGPPPVPPLGLLGQLRIRSLGRLCCLAWSLSVQTLKVSKSVRPKRGEFPFCPP